MNKGVIAVVVAVLVGGVAFMLTHKPEKVERRQLVRLNKHMNMVMATNQALTQHRVAG